MKYCEVCGNPNAEVHHIIFRSEASYLANVSINYKYLCSRCHRGKNGPHINADIDLKYKRELQDKLFSLFSRKVYYSEEEIKKRLILSSSEVIRIFKDLKKYKEGYKKEEIISICMGGRLYMDEAEKELMELIERVKVV